MGLRRAADSIIACVNIPDGVIIRKHAWQVWEMTSRTSGQPPLEIRPRCPFIRTSVHRRNFLYADIRASVFGASPTGEYE